MSAATDTDTMLLRERALALARPAARVDPAEQILELLEFHVAGEHYAVESRHVAEVQPLRELTPLPGTPPWLRGVVNLRGRILAVYDLRRFFSLPEQGLTDLHRIVVLDGGDFEIGLLVDVVKGVRQLLQAALSPAPATLSGIGAEFIKGVSGERLVVLDLARIVSDPRIVMNDGVNE